ncbi:ATP-dependent helicase HrpB [Cohnella pontilimi]|uniref:ATP-dependent helicase HrpB n=1 Tax=Cohnella pontilimi TaxID=2564100 RepID=A0A4U0FBQ6_9BACL|nr:ATP-dependent helicase HrpB [Cohnella pontilimi]TJY42150.1 ATP-dependent helicase HrpB [Cohnella pontilimi]
MRETTLPVETSLPALRQALSEGTSAVLVAAPGAGKTTRVPLAMLEELWLEGRKIVMLEPRRLAARSAARYMAALLGEPVGQTVGYRVRMDTKVGPRTRIEVVTEGVLTRMLQEDPGLEQIALVIFDEFHERSLQADLGLALCLQTQELLREDLRLLVMSATIEAEPVARLLGGAPVIVSEGRQFPVETFYRRPARAGLRIEDRVEPVVREALRERDGDLLVFLPGMAEIRAVERKLQAMIGEFAGGPAIRICPLHGSLPPEAQDRAISPAIPGERKIVLSTSVAETSLTVEGITVVIDSGLARVSRFSPRTGMSRLETTAVSAASAEQRRGRAGRLQAGTCYRLWSEEEQHRLAPSSSPEIREADLAPLVLELAAWGTPDPAELSWLDAPPVASVQQARELLRMLGALTSEGAITPHGREMAAFGIHPRLSHMLLRVMPLGLGSIACEIAVLLGDRDFTRAAGGPDTDFRHRLEALHGRGPLKADEGARRRLLEEAERLKRECGVKTGADRGIDERPEEVAGLLLAFAYPDRIGRRREGGKYLLSGGRGAAFQEGQPLAREEWIVVADVDDTGTESRIRLAAPVTMAGLLRHFRDVIMEERSVTWDRSAKAVRARVRSKLGALMLDETPMPSPPADEVAAALLEGIREEGAESLPWSRTARQFQERAVFVRRSDPSWPDLSDDALLATLEEWLSPYVVNMKSVADLQRLNLKEALESLLPWIKRRELDELAPTHWSVPSGSRLPIDYTDPDSPVLAVRLQELFGLSETPRIAGGRVPLTLHLLSPAQRPVQVTRDLASFWSHAYFEVRKDLKGRYPKHYWPDNPLEAQATRRAKPRD